MKALVILLLLGIVGSLGSALASMTAPAGPERSLRMVHALTLRISLSVALFVLLLLSYYFGWIAPHSVH